MPSHLFQVALCVFLLQPCPTAWAGSSQTSPTLTTANQIRPDPQAARQEELPPLLIAEKSGKSAQKNPVEGRRTYTARLYGSLCVSCLKHLNSELNKRSGVFESVIDRAVKKEANDGRPATYEKWANAKVIYDASKVSKDDITKRIKQSDFIVRRVEDVGEDDSSGSDATKSNEGTRESAD